MTNKDGQYVTKLPTVKGNFNPTNKRDFKIQKCFNCGKKTMQSYIERMENNDGKQYRVKICTRCKYSNYNPIL